MEQLSRSSISSEGFYQILDMTTYLSRESSSVTEKSNEVQVFPSPPTVMITQENLSFHERGDENIVALNIHGESHVESKMMMEDRSYLSNLSNVQSKKQACNCNEEHAYQESDVEFPQFKEERGFWMIENNHADSPGEKKLPNTPFADSPGEKKLPNTPYIPQTNLSVRSTQGPFDLLQFNLDSQSPSSSPFEIPSSHFSQDDSHILSSVTNESVIIQSAPDEVETFGTLPNIALTEASGDSCAASKEMISSTKLNTMPQRDIENENSSLNSSNGTTKICPSDAPTLLDHQNNQEISNEMPIRNHEKIDEGVPLSNGSQLPLNLYQNTQGSNGRPYIQSCGRTPPPSLTLPYYNINSVEGKNLCVSQSKEHKSGRVVRPFVYSAIGSLECINQNSLGSFNHKLLLASKAKEKILEGQKFKLSKNIKKNQIHDSKADNGVVTVYHGGISSSKVHSSLSHPVSSGLKLSKSMNFQQEVNEDDKISSKIYEGQERSSLKSSPKFIAPSLRRGKKAGKKNRVKIDLDANKVRPVELFRPSCDAYTPRMGQKEIKYKPAKERASIMEEMPTTMGTIQRPDFRGALRRVAIIMQQHIVKIERRFEIGVPGLDNAGLFIPAMRDAFAEDNFVTARYKCNMVNIPMARGGVMFGMRKIRTKYNIPTANDIYEFAYRLFNSVQLSSECSIICLIYIERLMEVAKVPVMANTWRPIFMCGLLLASKVWQDLSSWNVEFSIVYPQFTLDAINRLESQFLKMIKWKLYISSSLYAKYYFALRHLTEKQGFRQKYNRMVGGVDSRAALEAVEVSKKSEMVKVHLSRSM